MQKALTGETIDVTPEPENAGSTGRRYKNYRLGAIAAILIAMLTGAVYLWQSRSGIAQVAPFANSSVKQLTSVGNVNIAALSPDGKLFAYVKNEAGQKSLWLGFVEGGNHLQLRQAEAASYHKLAFSPDGGQLYFSLRSVKNPKSALFRMPASGGAQQKISDEISSFALSSDGSRLAFARRAVGEAKEVLYISKIDGTEKREVAAFPKTQAIVSGSVSWSADGNRLALGIIGDDSNLEHDLVVVEISSGQTHLIDGKFLRDINNTVWLADGSGLIVTAIAGNSWSSVPQFRLFHIALPDGEIYEMTTDRSGYGTSLGLSGASDLLLTVEHRQLNNIWIAPLEDLGAARQITFGSFGKYDGLWGMDFTPDGKLIYTNSDTQSQFISVMNASGEDARPLTAPGVVDSVLMVSGDGRHVVFHSNRGGGFDIWRMDIDGSNLKQMTFGGKGFQPFISADSRWIYYKSWLNEIGELRRVSIDGGEPETLNDKETSWGGFSPDGRHFAAAYVTDKSRLAIFSAATNEVVRQFDLPETATLNMGLRWTPDSRAVVFRDSAFGYWKQPVEGGEPHRLENLPKEKFYNFAFSKDGKWFAFVRGQEIRDVVLFQRAPDKSF